MAKAYVDTTILTDVLLKIGSLHEAAKSAIGRYAETQLPVYAIKEFKAGPLTHFVYMHNKLVQTGSFTETLGALARLSTTLQRNKISTAIEALKTASDDIASHTDPELQKKYAETAGIDATQCDVYRLVLKRRIFKAWRDRRNVTTSMVLPLSCYEETAPSEKRGLIDIRPRICPKDVDCCLRQELIERPDDLKKLRAAVGAQPEKPENQKRMQALRHLIRTPRRPIGDKECRNLGDAIFAFFAPSDAAILTTNERDHRPLAEALGKKVDTP